MTKTGPSLLWEAHQLQLQACRDNFFEFCQYVKPDYIPADHLRTLARALERVERGDCKRLIVSMPPRHGKSLTGASLFPCWAAGRDPRREIVVASYAQTLSETHSKIARNIYQSDEYKHIFPRSEEKNLSTSLSQWDFTDGGKYFAVGVDGPLTGKGAHIGIIDDPVKDRAEAGSITIQQRNEDWYKSVFRNRMHPDEGSIIIIMTRWAPNDLVGCRLAAEGADSRYPWETVVMPAWDDERTPLWPGRFSLEDLEELKRDMGDFEWSALYMQEPVVRGGNIFKTGGVQVHDTIEDFPAVRYSRAWDLASTSKQRGKNDPDYTVGALGAIVYDRKVPHLWISDLRFCQKSAPERDAMIIGCHDKEQAGVEWHIEGFGGYKDTAENFKHLLMGKRSVSLARPKGDKLTKASPLEPIFEAGNVHILRAPWNDIFFQQFATFDGLGGTHDDVVDAVAMLWHVHRRPKSGIVMR